MTDARSGEDAGTLPPALAALEGCLVSRLTVDDALTLGLSGVGRAPTLRLDGAGVVEHGGARHAVDVDRDPRSAAALLGLLGGRVAAVHLRRDGALELRCDLGMLVCEPHEHQVSWQVQGPDGTRCACLAEGMVVWA